VLPAPLLHLATLAPTPTPTLTPTPVPSPSPSSGLGSFVPDGLTQALQAKDCTKDEFSVCGVLYRWTDHRGIGQFFQVLFGAPLRLLLIVVLAVYLRRVLHRVIDRLAERITSSDNNGGNGSNGSNGNRGDKGTNGNGPDGGSVVVATRREARARTLSQVLRSATTILVTVIAGLMVMQELEISTGPLLAGASVLGVALGLGAQSLIRDVVSGMFMIAEDQYGVGDVIDVGVATGSVEAVGLRVTRLRDVNGTLWYVRNGEILRVGNQSQGWARSVLDVHVGLGEDLDHVEEVLLTTASQLRSDPVFGAFVLDEPEVWGVESLSVDGVLMRVVVKTQPMQQWPVTRELRRRIKYRFDAEGIQMQSSPKPVIEENPEPRPARTHDTLE
jgi:moderate conductance mechanosensitive channel